MSDAVQPCTLVFGKNGQVAQELSRLSREREGGLVFAGRETCDLVHVDPDDLINRLRPAAVINASAYTAVDRAEAEPDLAFRLNRDVVGRMAACCAALRIPFIHISTDYVFDGEKSSPYVETDFRNPVSIYGKSKAEGEIAIEAAGGLWTIFRTAWVFSAHGSNFIKTMIRLGKERDVVSVVADQWGRPTLAADIAELCIKAAAPSRETGGPLTGLHHLAGADDAVWADVAEHVFSAMARQTGKVTKLNRIGTSDYPTPAKRPLNSRLDTTQLQIRAGWSPRPWRDAVDVCLGALL